jgi:hypothetical protein
MHISVISRILCQEHLLRVDYFIFVRKILSSSINKPHLFRGTSALHTTTTLLILHVKAVSHTQYMDRFVGTMP